MKIAFALKEVTYLKSFMPLIRLWGARHEILIFIYSRNEKLTSPVRNRESLEILKPYPWVWYKKAEDVIRGCRERGFRNLITLEGEPFQDEDNTDRDLNVVVITHMVDFTRTLPWYYEDVDRILLHSRYMTHNLEFKDEQGKFLYTGYPQYLVLKDLDAQEIRKKYDLPAGDRILCVLGPKKMFYRETHRVLKEICDYARERGLYIVYKTRKKDRVSLYIRWLLRNHRYFYDVSFYPPTSLELMFVSDLVINFDSTGIQEILMLEKKVVNFFTKHYRFMTEIYAEDAVTDLNLETPRDELFEALDRALAEDRSKEIRALKEKYFLQEDQILENLLEFERRYLR